MMPTKNALGNAYFRAPVARLTPSRRYCPSASRGWLRIDDTSSGQAPWPLILAGVHNSFKAPQGLAQDRIAVDGEVIVLEAAAMTPKLLHQRAVFDCHILTIEAGREGGDARGGQIIFANVLQNISRK